MPQKNRKSLSVSNAFKTVASPIKRIDPFLATMSAIIIIPLGLLIYAASADGYEASYDNETLEATSAIINEKKYTLFNDDIVQTTVDNIRTKYDFQAGVRIVDTYSDDVDSENSYIIDTDVQRFEDFDRPELIRDAFSAGVQISEHLLDVYSDVEEAPWIIGGREEQRMEKYEDAEQFSAKHTDFVLPKLELSAAPKPGA